MSFISPALISKIYQALGKNRGNLAILLLRQHSFDGQPADARELMPAVVRLADECFYSGQLERAKDHFKLGLALYESCFSNSHIEALRCASGILSIYEQDRSIDNSEVSATILLCQHICGALAEQHVKPRIMAV